MMMISLGCFRPRLLKSRLKKREVESPETDLYTNGVRVAMKKEEHQKKKMGRHSERGSRHLSVYDVEKDGRHPYTTMCI